MAKKLSPSDQAALAALRDRVLLTVRFIAGAEGYVSAGRLEDIAETAFAKGDLRSLRLVAREVDAMTIGLATHQREGLEALLKARLGIDKDAERAELSKQVSLVLRRGAIASERERRRLEDYVEMLDATGGDPAEAEAVRRLLSKD